MKYSIEGIDKAKVIKSVDIIDGKKTPTVDSMNKTTKVIMVNYLDGTQDVFKFNNETLENIKNIMLIQAKEYTSKSKTSLNKLTSNKITSFVLAGLFSVASMTFLINNIIMVSIPLLLAALLSAINAVRLDRKCSDIQKYNMFLKQVIDKIDYYNEILTKEKTLNNSKNKQNPKFTGIIDLDKTSVKDLNYIVNKVERYQSAEGKSPKVKSL